MVFLSSYILFDSAVASASAFTYSDYCTSASCNESGLFFLLEADCSILVPVKLACMSSMTFYFEKYSVSGGFNFG